MTIEIRELHKKKNKYKSDLEIIKKQSGLKEKKNLEIDETSAVKKKIDEKISLKEQKKIAKQILSEEKKRIKEEKRLEKQARLEEKKKIKNKKKSSNKFLIKNKKKDSDSKITLNKGISNTRISSDEFDNILEKITKRNKNKPFPDINKIPN